MGEYDPILDLQRWGQFIAVLGKFTGNDLKTLDSLEIRQIIIDLVDRLIDHFIKLGMPGQIIAYFHAGIHSVDGGISQFGFIKGDVLLAEYIDDVIIKRHDQSADILAVVAHHQDLLHVGVIGKLHFNIGRRYILSGIQDDDGLFAVLDAQEAMVDLPISPVLNQPSG